MKRFKTFILIAVLGFTAYSCDSFLDVNTDPNAATEVSPDVLFPPVLANVSANRAIETMPGTAFFVNSWSPNYVTGLHGADRYIISPFGTGNTWISWYGSGLRNLNLMVEFAEEGEQLRPNVASQAKIMQAYLFFSLTMMWETVPFTEALDPDEFPNPEFDDQETILYGVIDMLDEALDQIAPGEPAVEFGDLIYGGDMSQWEKFANSLKLRTYMYLRNQHDVDDEIQDLLQNAELIRTNDDMAYIPFFDSEDNAHNLWKVHNQFNGFLGTGNGGYFVSAGKTLVDFMNELDDPRRNTYFAFMPQDDGSFLPEDFTGQVAGRYGSEGDVNYISQNIITRDWPNRILTPSEVYFYEAEFYATRGELGAAHDAYVAGVQTSLDFLDPWTQLDPREGSLDGIPEADKQAYMDNLPATFNNEEAALEAIWTQHYIEIFDRSPENWSEWRRTKFPSLTVAEQAELGDIIRRYPFPPSELQSNPNIPPEPVLDTPMWFEN